MQIPLILGRGFLYTDNETATPVAIVNQTMANRLWPEREPIGRRFSLTGDAGPFLEVVGVARDSKYQTVTEILNLISMCPSRRTMRRCKFFKFALPFCLHR